MLTRPTPSGGKYRGARERSCTTIVSPISQACKQIDDEPPLVGENILMDDLLAVKGHDPQQSGPLDRSVDTIIVDRSALFRVGLTHILADTCFRVIANCGSLDDLPDDSLDRNGALLLLDLDGSDVSLARISQTKTINPSLRIIALSENSCPRAVLLALTSGADGFLVKNEISPQLFLKSLELALLGAAVIPQGLVLAPADSECGIGSAANFRRAAWHDQLPSIEQSRAAPVLSARERLVLRRLMEGASNKVIARDIGIAEATVKVHVKSLLRKIRVRNRTQAAMWGINHFGEPDESDADRGSSVLSVCSLLPAFGLLCALASYAIA
jgi:DNA-binding NarL/FixJ family response regulator